MTKNTTKRALLLSVMALVLCFTMLLGTTFAWFTDSVTSGKNTIVAGNLDIELEYSKTMADGSWKTVQGATDLFDDEALWEPGHAEVVYLKISNLGSLALKYKLMMNIAKEVTSTNVNGGTLKLSEHLKYAVVDVTAAFADRAAAIAAAEPTAAALANYSVEGEMLKDAAAKTVALVVYMPETVGNEANYAKDAAIPTIELGVSVVATQLAHESDSFNNQYDVDAMYAVADGLYVDETTGGYVATNKTGLSNAAAKANDDDTITSVTYVDETGAATEVPVVSDLSSLNSAIAGGDEVVVLKEGTYNVPSVASGKEIDIVGTEDTVISITNTNNAAGGSTLNFTGVTIQGQSTGNYAGMGNGTKANYVDCTFNGKITLYGSTTFTNCVFNSTNDYSVWTWGAGTVEFTDCTFNSQGKALYVYANVLDNGTNHQTVKVTNCEFYDTGANSIQKAAIETGDDYNCKTYDLFITNTTVDGFAVTEDKTQTLKDTFGYEYGGSDFGTNLWGNKYLMGTDKLNVVIDGVDVH